MNSNQMLTLSADVLRALYAARSERITLDDLCEAVGVTDATAREGVRVRARRREDVRETVRRLDEEGFVDAMRMKLTLQGFTLAASLSAPSSGAATKTTRRLVPLHLVA